MIIEAISVGAMGANCYILAAGKGLRGIIIDPGDEGEKILQVLKTHQLTPGIVINTHGHYDHIAANDKFGLEVYVHRLDVPLLIEPMLNLSGLFAVAYKVKSKIKPVEEGEIISLDGVELKVLHTPGHTQGGISLLMLKPENNMVFTGDTLFCRGIGRSDLPGGNEDVLFNSIRQKLFILPDETKIFPGHGPSSTIKEEKKNLL